MTKLKKFLTEENWCSGFWSQDADGRPCSWKSDEAVKFCLMGALHKVYSGDEYWQMQDRLAALIRVLHNRRIADFNDIAEWDDIEFILRSIDL